MDIEGKCTCYAPTKPELNLLWRLTVAVLFGDSTMIG